MDGEKKGRPYISHKRFDNITEKLMSLFVNDMETVDKVLSIVCQEINYDPYKNTYDPRMKEHMKKYRQNLKIK